MAVTVLSTSLWSPAPAFAVLTDAEWAAAQARLDVYADRVVGGRDSNEAADLGWFVDIQYDVPAKRIDLFTTKAWANTSITQPAAAEGITITNSVRTKSLAELVTAQRQLSDQMQADGVITGGYTIDINPTGTTQGLSVDSQSTNFDHTAVPNADSAWIH